jgi:hypothetical protein
MNMSLQLEKLKNVIMDFIRSQQSRDHNSGNRHDWSSGHRGPKVRKLSSYQSRSSKADKVSISPASKRILLRDVNEGRVAQKESVPRRAVVA